MTGGKRRIIFRADGNAKIGLGHVVRSLALAQMLRQDFECVFAIQAPSAALQNQIRQVCHGLIVLPFCSPEEERFTFELAAYVSEEEVVVLDGYHFRTAYQNTLKEKGATLVCIDDTHAYSFVADAVINPAGGIRQDAYKAAPYTKLCLGPYYALLRPSFLKAAQAAYKYPEENLRVLLVLGGADPLNHTLRAAKELAETGPVEHLEIVVGSAYRYVNELKDWLLTKPRFALHHNLSAEELCGLMQNCHAAVTSPSGVAYEYCSVGGILFVQQTADNQENIAHFLLENRLALDYSQIFTALSGASAPQLHREFVSRQRAYFDGNSSERLLRLFRQLSLLARLELREACPEDLTLLFSWANDPEVRARSFNTEPISLQSHTCWFETKLADANSRLYIASVEGEPAAHIRFDLKGETAVISYLVARSFRGKGLGHSVLMKGIAKLREGKAAVRLVEGLVQKDNTASIRAFEKAGFSYASPNVNSLHDAHRFILEIEN